MPASAYNCHYVHATGTLQIVLLPGFRQEYWDELMHYVENTDRSGNYRWDLDLRRIEVINSMMLGLIVGLRARLDARGGNLRVLIAPNSKVEQLLQLTRLDQIVETVKA
ncbi:MAG TPA: STAS domain-containing protein [Candidatus Sumerlaeota bacterium]|mgnify:CR=1 FL=1|nr:MAG: putative anti-sigma factor antagonist [candidate division BRC1 bacterium ADurb.BinA292]HOE95218.1 STAS domain-containing protein [Candidatus Sumerlaeota bacterium]HOR28643.1 STAS domain-containing protein [Candidatus Sumerlaeota bacterium]HPK01424.1 STAS domain-containing protein [Candidatus Sumerlaeota bacterium]